jgi:endonuclease VIII
MPEGPSIVILKEVVHKFKGQKVISATGTAKVLNFVDFKGNRIVDFRSWGKHFLICFNDFTIRIHLLMFGSYTIDGPKNATPRLAFKFSTGELNFYSCAVTLIDQPIDGVYDWTADVMNKKWDSKLALEKLKANGEMLICDALLDQTIFAGVGNIIKNEVLYRVRVHPKSKTGKIPLAKRRKLVDEAVKYSFQFLEWKKEFTLKKHWLVHTKKACPRHGSPLQKEYLGKTSRRSFFCESCQKLYE